MATSDVEKTFPKISYLYYTIGFVSVNKEEFKKMIENPITYGNHHDSSARDFMDYCQGCDGEIFYGEGYLDFSGDPIHTESECIKQYVEEHSMKKVAGE